jgi:hypothetical protein
MRALSRHSRSVRGLVDKQAFDLMETRYAAHTASKNG